MEIEEIEHKIACNEMKASQVFTQMLQHIQPNNSEKVLQCDHRLTHNKTKALVNDGYKVSGFVLTKTDLTSERKIVELGAVRSLSNNEMWELMHPQSQD